MKRIKNIYILVIISILVFSFSLIACSKKNENEIKEGLINANIEEDLTKDGKTINFKIDVNVNLIDDGFKASKFMVRDISYGIYSTIQSSGFFPETFASKSFNIAVELIQKHKKDDKIVYSITWKDSSGINDKDKEFADKDKLKEYIIKNLSIMTGFDLEKITWIDIPNKDYKISKYEITSAQFYLKREVIKKALIKLVKEKGYKTILEGTSWKMYRADAREKRFCTCGSLRNLTNPMNCVNYIAAELYCNEIGAKMPSAEEWEYAYKAGTDTKYWWGDEFDGNKAISDVKGKWRRYSNLDDIEIEYIKQYLPKNYTIRTKDDVIYELKKNDEGIDEIDGDDDLIFELLDGTAPLDRSGIRCNNWQLCDMAGNVWEWVSDKYRDGLNKAHGGAWDYHNAKWYTAKHEAGGDPKNTYPNIGFRCIKSNSK